MKRLGLCAVLGLMGLAGGAGSYAGAQGAGDRPMTFADLMAMKRVSDPQISSSGKWVLFSVTNVSLEKNTKVNHLWVVSITGGKEVQITSGDGESNGRFSPDGKWISMTVKDQVYLAPWDEAAGKIGEARQLTSVTGGADGAIWSPDSRRLLFTAQVYPECSVKGGEKALRTLEPLARRVVIAGSLQVPEWKNAEPAPWTDEDACNKAKDEAAEKNPVKGQIFDGLLYRHWEHWTGGKRSHILVIDTNGKNVRDLTPANAVGDAETPTFFVSAPTEYAWAPDSKEIAYVTNLDPVPAASTNNDVFTLRLDEPGAKAVKVSTAAGSDDEPEYSPDGKWLAFRSQARGGFESDQFRLTLYDRTAKNLRDVPLVVEGYSGPPKIIFLEPGETPSPVAAVPRALEHDLDLWVDEFLWASDSQRIFFVAGDKGQEVIYGTNVPSGNLHRYGKIVGSALAGEWSSLIQIGPGYRLAGLLMKVEKPAEIAIANLSEMDDTGFVNAQLVSARKTFNLREGVPPATPNYLTHVNEALLASLNMSPLEPFWFMGAEGTKVEGFLLKPPNFDPAKKYPVKFLMHGGPQTAWGDAWSYRWNWELFASSGYVVIGINRRGSTGYGQKFVDEVSGDWGGRAYEDLMKGLDYAEAHYSFLDKDRECALGASYGGYMANWVLTHTNRFKCIVTHDGVYDPAAAWGSTEEIWFNEWEFRMPQDYPKGWDGFATAGNGEGHPAEPWRYASLPPDQDPFRKWSPMRFIANAKTPTLIIHSQHDYRLDVSQGFEMFTALQQLGVPSKMLYFPDEGHWVLKPRNSELWNEVVGDWCDKWTHSGTYAPGNP